MPQTPDIARARIGFIVPASNRMAEPHFATYAPAGVVGHTARLRMTGPHRMKLEDLLPRVAEAAVLLDDVPCDPIVFHCTANSMAEGVAAERRIVDTIATATGRKATTTASATLAALEALNARRVVLISPYTRASHEHEIAFLTEAGLEIVAERNLAMPDSAAYSAAEPALWRDIVAEMKTDRADAYFVSCANIRAIDMLDEMEEITGRPVLTSNQVVLWQGLRLAGIADSVPGIGRLLREGAAV